MLSDYSVASDLRYVSLRYFNAAGAAPVGNIGEDHNPASHLIPLVIKTAQGFIAVFLFLARIIIHLMEHA